MQEDALSYRDKLHLFGKDARLYIVANAIGAFGFGISNVVFNLYMLRIPGIEEDFLGIFLSISMFATAFIGIGAGILTDRWSRKKTLLAAGLISNCMIAVQYTVINPTSLMLSQVILGLSSAFQQVGWTPYITDLSTDRERTHLFAFGSGMSILGVFFGNLVGGFLPGLFNSFLSLGGDLFWMYKFALWTSLVPIFLSTFLIIPMTRDKPRESTLEYGLKKMRSPGFIGKYALTISTAGLGAGMIVMYFNLYFEYFGADAAFIGIIFGINMIILSAGNFIAPALADRIGKVRTIVITEIFSVPFLIMLWYAASINVIYLGIVAYVSRTALMNMAGPVSGAFFMEVLSKDERATAMGVVRTGDSFVRAVAAIIGGWMLAQSMYSEPYLIVSGLYILSIIMFFNFFRRTEHELEELRSADIIVEEDEELGFEVT